MSTHALGNVQLITVQEVEAMLDEVVVPEASIDAKVAAEATAREAADQLLQGNIDNENAAREAAGRASSEGGSIRSRAAGQADQCSNEKSVIGIEGCRRASHRLRNGKIHWRGL